MSMPIPISEYADVEFILDGIRRRLENERIPENTMEEEFHFPKFQYSVFVDPKREEQLVVRADSFQDFQEQKQQIDLLVKARKSNRVSNPTIQTEAMNGLKLYAHNGSAEKLTCARCGGEATFRSGFSKKNNRPYKGVFCKDKTCNFARFF